MHINSWPRSPDKSFAGHTVTAAVLGPGRPIWCRLVVERQESDVIKPMPHFRNLDQFTHHSRAHKLFFAGEPPTSTAVEVSAMLPAVDMLVELEATVCLPLKNS